MADLPRKRIITCAITGAIHSLTKSEALPYVPEDTAGQAVAVATPDEARQMPGLKEADRVAF